MRGRRVVHCNLAPWSSSCCSSRVVCLLWQLFFSNSHSWQHGDAHNDHKRSADQLPSACPTSVGTLPGALEALRNGFGWIWPKRPPTLLLVHQRKNATRRISPTRGLVRNAQIPAGDLARYAHIPSRNANLFTRSAQFHTRCLRRQTEKVEPTDGASTS